MQKLEFGFQWFEVTQSNIEMRSLPLQPEEQDSDISALEKQQARENGRTICNPSITKSESEQQLAYLLSNLLKYGVLIASAVVLFGGIFYLKLHGHEPAKYHAFSAVSSELCSPMDVVKTAFSGNSSGIIQLGLLMLVAIPIIRVIISLVTFLRLRDFAYVIICSLVLTSLVYSLVAT